MPATPTGHDRTPTTTSPARRRAAYRSWRGSDRCTRPGRSSRAAVSRWPTPRCSPPPVVAASGGYSSPRPSGPTPSSPSGVDERVFELGLAAVSHSHRGEAKDRSPALSTGHRNASAALDDPFARELEKLGPSQQQRSVPGIRQRGGPEDPLELRQIRRDRGADGADRVLDAAQPGQTHPPTRSARGRLH